MSAPKGPSAVRKLSEVDFKYSLMIAWLWCSHNWVFFFQVLKQTTFFFSPSYPSGPPQWLRDKKSAWNAGATGDLGLIPVSGRSPGGGNSNPLQDSCLENLMDRGATWHARVHGVAKSWTWLSTAPQMERKLLEKIHLFSISFLFLSTSVDPWIFFLAHKTLESVV